MTRRFYRLYCDECMTTHWIEVTDTRREICHGENYYPRETPTTYTRWRNGGIELVERMPNTRAMLDWRIAQEAREEAELALLNQDW